MKVYSVKPNSKFVRVSDGRVIDFVDRTAPLVILADVIGDENKAKHYLRFKWRWSIFDGWEMPISDRAVTEMQVREVIEQIDGTAAENAALIARQKREKPLYVSDAAGPDQGWSKNPTLRVNKPPERKDSPHVNTEGPTHNDRGDTG